jgi:hypothetical protein
MKKFPALHTISAIFRILSWIVGLLTIALVIATALGKFQLVQIGTLDKLWLAGAYLLIGGLYSLILHAAGELIMVAIAIEENTRKIKE